MFSNNIGFTQIDVKKTQFTWKINNFKHLFSYISTGNKLDSPTFSVKPNDSTKWQLFLWPNGMCRANDEFVSFSLHRLSSGVKLHLSLSLSLIDSRGEKRYEQRLEVSSTDGSVHIGKFIPISVLSFEPNDILLNNVLTVCCQLDIIYDDSLKNVDESIHQQPIDLTNKMLHAFEQQLEKQEFSDVKLVASCGKELPAHKFVLAARSPVFSAMFTNDMLEKSKNSVVIPDLDYDSLKEMLRFMYTGRVENLDKLSGEILAAQDKYQIDGLKELCEEYFFQNINVENAVEILALSVRFNIGKIKLLSEKFIRCHAKDVSNSAAFRAIDEPNFLAQIVYILAKV